MSCIAEGADSPEAEPCRGTKSYSTTLLARRAMLMRAHVPLRAAVRRLDSAVVEGIVVIRIAALISIARCALAGHGASRVPVLRLRGTVCTEVHPGAIRLVLTHDTAVNAG